MIRQIEVNPQNIELLKQLKLEPNEGVMFVKFVLLKPSTLNSGQAGSAIERSPSAILLGDLNEIKTTLGAWLEESVQKYC